MYFLYCDPTNESLHIHKGEHAVNECGGRYSDIQHTHETKTKLSVL